MMAMGLRDGMFAEIIWIIDVRGTAKNIPARPHIYPQTTHVSAFDKMSNEGRHSAFPLTKMQVGGFRGPSQAIRKIHFVIGSRRMTYV